MTSQQERGYEVHQPEGGVPIKRWTRGVAVEDAAVRQLENVARMPFIHRWVAAMPDVHWGMRATFSSCRTAASSTATPRVQRLIGTPPSG